MSEPVGVEAHQHGKSVGATLLRWLPLAILLCAMAAAFALGLHHYLSLEAIVDRRDELKRFVGAHWAAALAAYMAVYVVAVALSLPGGLVLTVLGGFLFGWLVGAVATVVAATAGACCLFLIARTSLGAALAERAGPALERLTRGFRQDAVFYLLFLRLVPVFPFWLVNLAPSLVGVPFGVYAVTTFFGILPGTLAFSVAGAGLDSAVAGQRNTYEACVAAGRTDCRAGFDVHALLTPELVAAFVALGLVALVPAIVRRLWRKRFSGLD